MYPIAVLIDELRHEDVQTRLNAVQQLEHIAIALGPTRTRNELIPFLMESADESDVVLGASAEKLGKLIEAVGGPDFAHTLLRPLEDLLMLEEAAVRDKAMESVIKVINRMPTKHVAEFGSQLVSRLAINDWFVARVSACTIIPELFMRAYSDDLFRAFMDLCEDDTPMVRRAAVIAIGNIGKYTPQQKQRDLLDALRRLDRDDQDSVRIMTIPTALKLAKEVFTNPQECYNALFPEFRACSDDVSWRVRVTVADSIHEIIANSPSKHQQQVFDMYVKLLSDSEADVRTVAVSRLSEVTSFRPTDRNFLNLVLPSINKLVRDDVEQVRVSLAESLAKTCPLVGPALAGDSLLQFILKLLRDTSSTVVLKMLGNLKLIAPQLKLEEFSPFVLPAVKDLTNDRQWRVRISILDYMPQLVGSLGHKLFVTEFSPAIQRLLVDPVFKVRDAAASSLAGVAAELGAEETIEHLLPHVVDLSRNNNYLNRITALMSILSLSKTLGQAIVGEELAPIVLGLASDPVPNVRFNVAKVLRSMYDRCPRPVGLGKIVPALRQLTADPDKDVKFYAKEAIVAIDAS